jgi:hypothetical protein
MYIMKSMQLESLKRHSDSIFVYSHGGQMSLPPHCTTTSMFWSKQMGIKQVHTTRPCPCLNAVPLNTSVQSPLLCRRFDGMPLSIVQPLERRHCRVSMAHGSLAEKLEAVFGMRHTLIELEVGLVWVVVLPVEPLSEPLLNH